jgi:hypothetical protein
VTTPAGERFSNRRALEVAVTERAVHRSLEHVRTTCSLARAERLIGREYHGRFLIELLQNAADAWREDPRSHEGGSRVHAVLTEEPALLVANEGVPVTVDTVIGSLGHIGATTKPPGEAIGHKGIGFKSVLEICDRPEIHSGLRGADRLAVAFDVAAAAESIKRAPRWDEYLAEVDNVEPDDPRTWVPVLRFPTWVEQVPDDVGALADAGYDTVVRLPLRGSADGSADLTVEQVRRALDTVTDEMLLLLDGFRQVTVEDRLRASVTVVERDEVADEGPGTKLVVRRGGQRSSSWRLHRDRLQGGDGQLASELTVGLRIDDHRVVSLGDGAGAAFHLFFPTRIASGTPLLLHGYFEVDAARTGFYGGSADHNQTVLDGLSDLAASSIERTLTQQPQLAISLAVALARPVEPTDPLARRFRDRLFERLDEVAWVPTVQGSTASLARPTRVLALPQLAQASAAAFDGRYVHKRTGRYLPAAELPVEVLELVRARQGDAAADEFDTLETLLTPGDLDVWSPPDSEPGFRAVLDLLDVARGVDRTALDAMLTRLRSDPASRIVPIAAGEGIRLRPCADPAGGRAGAASRVLMARVRQTGRLPLSPPTSFGVEFLPDALLASEEEVDRARHLGVRPFTVDSILDRLGAIDADRAPEPVLAFLWQLLDRERASSFGLRSAADDARMFDPTAFYWCRPRRNLEQDTGAPRQRRERNLATVRVPCRDGSWHPAGRAALGADWAEWIEARDVGVAADRPARAASLRTLERLAPDESHLLTGPKQLLGLLADPQAGQPEHLHDQADDLDHDLRILTFLLRLGVWQVLPVEGFDDLTTRDRQPRPWAGELDEQREQLVAAAGGWEFESRPARPHRNSWIGEDHRFLWPLEQLAASDPRAVAQALQFGLPLYDGLQRCTAFCVQCHDGIGTHHSRHRSGPSDELPSHLLVELRHGRWVPAERDGQPLSEPVSPQTCWWGSTHLGDATRRTSPERYLDRTDPSLGVTPQLATLARIVRVDSAPLHRLLGLLHELRTRHDSDELSSDLSESGVARQAFVGLHRRIYRRLAELIRRAAELGPSDEDRTLLDDARRRLAYIGVLCERGRHLVYERPSDARHDDGTYTTHIRHFTDELSRIVLPRDAWDVAGPLGIPKLELTFCRTGDDSGVDVTDQLAELYHDRVPELLAILVHHSQGATTLEPTSHAFDERARRLQQLVVRQLDRLVLEVQVEGSALHQSIGGSGDDHFLDGPTTSTPVLYHDLRGADWVDRLRRHLAPHVAAMAENPAYEHTFEAFFNRESDAEREHFLLTLGIRPDDVDRITARVGQVSDAERRRRRRWFAAVATCLGQPTRPEQVNLDELSALLHAAELDGHTVGLLVAAGGGSDVRQDGDLQGVLAMLAGVGVDLDKLDQALRALGDDGLDPGVASERFRRWRDANRWPLIAVLAGCHDGPDGARDRIQRLRAPARLTLQLDPPLPELLAPFVEELAACDLQADPGRLAADPLAELARLVGYADVEQLQGAVAIFRDHGAWQRELQQRAAAWREVLVDLAVLTALTDDMTRAHIRELDAAVHKRLPHVLDRPSDLTDHLAGLFPDAPELAAALRALLVDELAGPKPTIDTIEALARQHGVPTGRHPELLAARTTMRRRTERVRRQAAELRDAQLSPTQPPGLTAPPAPAEPSEEVPVDRKKVRRVKVDESVDRRRRRTGDDAEQWVLAATAQAILTLPPGHREHALEALSTFLGEHFEGEIVNELRYHATRASGAVDDEDEFLEHLLALLHVAAVSDGFGFDVLGWYPVDGDGPVPMCLEVKSTTGTSFHLTASEWQRAQAFHGHKLGHRYAVVSVVRQPTGGVPARMDLLANPVALEEAKLLTYDVDGYVVRYKVT